MFIYEPVDCNVRRYNLTHQPKVQSVCYPDQSPEDYITEQYITAGRKAKAYKKTINDKKTGG